MFEAFQTEDGKMVSQKDIVNGILFALQSCEGKFEKFREQLSRVQKDEKVIKQLFDTYRPASQLTAKAFIWMINKIYCGLVKNEYRRFNIQVINRLGVNVVLKDEQTTVGQIAAGGTRFIESGPYRYNNSPGFYYNTGNTLKEHLIYILVIMKAISFSLSYISLKLQRLKSNHLKVNLKKKMLKKRWLKKKKL